MISNQISVYKTDKKLLELSDKLHPAPIEYYAHISAQGDKMEDGSRTYSNIGILLQDYSAGKGDAMKRASANLSPDELLFIYSRAYNGAKEFEFHSDKIFGELDSNGKSSVVKLTIRRAEIGSDGKPRRYPWYVEIENGRGEPQKTAIGGTYCKAGSFTSEAKLFINMSDLDFFKLFNRAAQYLSVWEHETGANLLRSLP